LARLAGLCLLGLFIWTGVQADERQLGPNKTVRGVVKRFTTAKKGEADGVVLDDGTIVHWWPHLEKRFIAVIKPGDRIEVTGRTRTTSEGVTVLEARTVTNLRTKVGAVNADTPGPRNPVPPAATPGAVVAEELKTVKDIVQRFTTAPSGAIDGMVLGDGTIVHWPADLEKRFTDIVAKGDRVEATGWIERTPGGNTVVQAKAVTNLRTKQTRLTGIVRTVRPPVTPTPPAPPPKSKVVTGTVKRMTRTAKGDVDGMVLDDGTIVRWPVRLQKRFLAIVTEGDRVEVVGRKEPTSGGKVVLDVGTVTNLKNKAKAIGEEALPAGPVPAAPARIDELEKRMRVLEDKMDRLLQAVEAMRRKNKE
jgi:hypothetical protein